MLHKLWVAMGLQFPTVEDAMRSRQKCTRIGYRNYCVKTKGAFAEAFTDHLHQHRYDTLALSHKEDLHEEVLRKAERIDYPCVVFFNEKSFSTIVVDDPNMEYPVQ
ncbi:hypothetical protein HOT49_gp284 [Erwinia phage vB_EamM_Alexandra]|uniref:Uncharacterized protein n=1 Tax=Erwinia phage vB_EamM_Alexandra TaxID=2201424 RepID=A0A2Z4QEY5_9CAUD|nr:hypothetical protein HOT49_gp284 [Erwinia phage vB_EamM_Alexandra]AWY08543.1 hypothetical protein Alexandra_287 [Erwinia phage vB_EamM_Alexandra]